MSVISNNPWLRRLAVVLVTVLSIGALTVPSAPATARVFIGVGVGAPVGWGYYAPPPYYGYYGYPYYRTYYGYPGFFVGGAFGPHRYWYHHSYWDHNHWR
jgi:hypothetical protein